MAAFPMSCCNTVLLYLSDDGELCDRWDADIIYSPCQYIYNLEHKYFTGKCMWEEKRNV